MKFISSVVLFFCALSIAHASTILIDFEDVTPQSAQGFIEVESKGFSFAASTYLAGGPPEAWVGSGGIGAYGDCFAWGEGCGAQVTMESINGGAFAIHSIGYFDGDFGGTLAGGGAADLSAPIGTGDWLNLEFFIVSNYCGFAPCGEYSAGLDDITVSAVPVPAAVWLFGSALAGLGWIRRKQLK